MRSPGHPGSEHGAEFFNRFENEINGKLDEMNKALDKQRSSAERATSEIKEDILALQRSIDGIVKTLEDNCKPAASKKKKIPNELSVRFFLPHISYLCGCFISGCG